MSPQVPGLRKETTDLGTLITKLIEQARLFEAQIQFIDEPYNPGASELSVEVTVDVTDAEATRMLMSGYSLPGKLPINAVQVNITGGTAVGRRLVAGSTGGIVATGGQSMRLSLVEGRGLPLVEADGTGTVLLSLTDVAGTGLDVSDTATVTFS